MDGILKNLKIIKLAFAITCTCCLIISNNSFAQKAIIEYSKNADEIILSFSETHGIMSGLKSKTTLDIYGDGTVKVFIPIFMKKAGNYQMKLGSEQLETLIQDLADKNIPEFDSQIVQSSKRIISAQKQLSSSQPVLHEVHDASVTTIELNLERYLKLTDNNSKDGELFDSSNEVLNMKKKIKWKGIRSDSIRFTDNVAIQQLASTHKSLTNMVNDPNLERK